jgi:hypothetical protein
MKFERLEYQYEICFIQFFNYKKEKIEYYVNVVAVYVTIKLNFVSKCNV